MSNKQLCGIYCIENIVNHKKYIGQSVDIKSRWRQHKFHFRNNRHNNTHFQYAWNKYGESSFKFFILEQCAKTILDERETYYINKYQSTNRDLGYNLESGGSKKGEISELTREKLRLSQINSKTNGRKVICLNTMEVFDKMRFAYQKYGITRSSLDYCCRGELKYAGRMKDGTPIQWAYYDDNIQHTYKPIRMVEQYDLNGNHIASYPTLKIASSESSVSSGAIGNCCRMNVITSGGYIWMYSDNRNDNIETRLKDYKNSKIITEERRKQLSEYGKQSHIMKRL